MFKKFFDSLDEHYKVFDGTFHFYHSLYSPQKDTLQVYMKREVVSLSQP